MVGTAGGRRPGHRVTSAAAPVLWDPGTASTSVMTKATVSAGIKPGTTVAVVGDGAVGLCGVLAASELGFERVIAMSRHQPRQQLAKEFGATDIVPERGDEGIARVKELTEGVGADLDPQIVASGLRA